MSLPPRNDVAGKTFRKYCGASFVEPEEAADAGGKVRAIIHRIRRLETAHAPDEQASAAVQAILASRRKRLGADYQEIEYPPGSFDGCRTVADRMQRARQLRLEREKREAATRNREPE